LQDAEAVWHGCHFLNAKESAMRSLIATLISLSLFVSVTVAAEYTVTNEGVYQLVFKFPPGSTVNGCDETPDVPVPPNGTVTEKSKAISKTFLRDSFEAASVSLAITSSAGSPDPKTQLKTNLTIAGGTFPGNKFDEWYEAIALISPAEQFSTVFLTQVNAGVVQAFTAGESVEGALDFFLILKIVTCVLQNIGEVDGADPALDFKKIMKIVTCIIGNLPPDNARLEPTPMPIPEKKPAPNGHIDIADLFIGDAPPFDPVKNKIPTFVNKMYLGSVPPFDRKNNKHKLPPLKSVLVK
jgi:hypothetical protein